MSCMIMMTRMTKIVMNTKELRDYDENLNNCDELDD